ncbi:hypothetical protein Hanom_Chr09g00825851 [Helianthus anomalus]
MDLCAKERRSADVAVYEELLNILLKNGRTSSIDLHLLLLCNRFEYYELMMTLFSIDLFFEV